MEGKTGLVSSQTKCDLCDLCFLPKETLNNYEKYLDFCDSCLEQAPQFTEELKQIVFEYTIKNGIMIPSGLERPNNDMMEHCCSILFIQDPYSLECVFLRNIIRFLGLTECNEFQIKKLCFALIPSVMLLISNDQHYQHVMCN